MTVQGTDYKYWAFLSYSHRDERWAGWLHRAVEAYRGHKRLVGSPNQYGEPVPERLFPVFRDRDELEGVPDLPARIQAALAQSRCLIVICSPRSAASRWVNEEIRIFKASGPKRDVLAFIVDGEPWAGDRRECFPQALRCRVGQDGQLTTQREEPGAVDARRDKDGRRNALLKILAKLLGVEFDRLRQRDQERRRRRGLFLTGGLALLASVLAVLAGLAWYQRQEAVYAQRRAEESAEEANRQRQIAEVRRQEAIQEKDRADRERNEAQRQRGIAETRARIALSRQLASWARNELPSGPGARFDLSRALLLAVQAVRTAPLAEGYAVLLKALQTTPLRMRFFWGHHGVVEDVVFAPDGTLISAGQDGRAIVWNIASAKPVAELATGTALYSAALDPKTGALALAGAGGEVSLWNLASRTRLGEPLKTDDRAIYSVTFGPDGGTLAAAGSGGRATLWDTGGRSASSTTLQGLGGPLARVAFSPDGTTVATAGAEGQLMLWDWPGGRPRGDALKGHQGGPFGSASAAAFSPDGKSLASAGSHSVLLVWDLSAQPPKARPLQGHDGAVLDVTFSPDGATLASGGKDGAVILWSSRQDGVLLQGQGDDVEGLAFSPDGKLLASAGRSGRLIVWDTASQPPLGQRWEGNREWVNRIDFSPDGRTLVSLGGELILWDSTHGRVQAKPRLDWVKSATFSPDGHSLAAVDANNQLLLVDLNAAPQEAHFLGERSADIRALRFSTDGRELYTVDVSKTVRVWDVSARRLLASHRLLAERERLVFRDMPSAAFSPDAKRLVWADSGGRVYVWDVVSRKPVREPMPGHDSSVLGLAFDPKGRTLLSQDQTGQIRLWDLRTTRFRGFSLTGVGSSFSTFAFSPNGATLATAVRDGIAGSERVILWDVATRRPLGEPMPTQSAVHSLAFSPDGELLAAGSKDRVYLWEAASRRALGELLWGHDRGITDLAFREDGRQLISAGGGIVAWDLDRRAWLERACRMANRNLSRGEWIEAEGKEVPYQRVCPDLPQPVPTIEVAHGASAARQ